MSSGYIGKLLFVDLTNHVLRDEMIPEKLRRDFIGGYGIGAKILLDHMKAGVDALGPDNILGFVTGPLTGTPAPTGNRYTVMAKSPLTGTWGDANSGGSFGPNLKFAGYDGVFFTGKSKKPVYLYTRDGKPEIRDAARLWGKDTFETEEILKSELGKDVEVACIGPSGERKSLIAAIMNNKGRAAARSGLGAVMGSKMLKAVAVAGKMPIPVADDAKANELRRKCLRELAPVSALFKGPGTPGVTLSSALSGDSPVKNWGGVGTVDFPDAKALSDTELQPMIAKRYGCWHCPLSCGGIMKESTGEYKYGEDTHRPEYETLSMFGSNCLNSNLPSIVKANDICNRYGMDTISVGAAVSFTIECYENGIISKSDTDGLEMTWGNHHSIISLTEKICQAEGFGKILADGVKKAAEIIGKGSEQYAIHIGGQELPAHDPKLGTHYFMTYKMDATPARHTQGSEGLNPSGLIPDFPKNSYAGRAEAHRLGINMQHIINCVGTCEFMYWALPDANVVPQFVNAIIGWDVTLAELIETGERISTIRHLFNLREGLNPLQLKVPDRVLGKPSQKEGPLAGVTIDEDTLVKEYLRVLDWDLVTTRPSSKRLTELGLTDIAKLVKV